MENHLDFFFSLTQNSETTEIQQFLNFVFMIPFLFSSRNSPSGPSCLCTELWARFPRGIASLGKPHIFPFSKGGYQHIVAVGWPWCLIRGLGWGVRPTKEVEGGSRKFAAFCDSFSAR